MFFTRKDRQTLGRIEYGIDLLLEAAEQTKEREEQFMATMQEILDEATQQGTVADSVLAIVKQLASEQDPAIRQQLFDKLKANRSQLEAAILAGTPQAP